MRLIIILAGAAMAASAFLNWMSMPFAGGFTPWDALRPVLGPDAPLEVWIFVGTFVLGALAALIALLGQPSRLITLLAGLAPFGAAIWNQMQAQDTLGLVGMTLWDFREGMGNAMGQMMELVDIGFFAYWVGAVLLIVAGLSTGRRPRHRDQDVF
jgi:hypothetical protein